MVHLVNELRKDLLLKGLIAVALCVLSSVYGFAQNSAYNMGYGWGLYDKGVAALCEGDYSTAFEYFEEGTGFHPMNYEGIGVCYELGFGVSVDHDEAWDAYSTGANFGNQACKMHLQRINQSGYWPKSYKNTFLNNLRNSRGGNYGTVPNGGIYNNSGSGNSYSNTCRICGGTGVCTSCGGTGGEWRDTGYYTGSNVKSWINCGSCRGSKRCFNCYGSGRQ